MKLINIIKYSIPSLLSAIYDLATRNIADIETREKRRAICKQCEMYYEYTKQCLLCGCFIKSKTRFKSQECPIKKW